MIAAMGQVLIWRFLVPETSAVGKHRGYSPLSLSFRPPGIAHSFQMLPVGIAPALLRFVLIATLTLHLTNHVWAAQVPLAQSISSFDVAAIHRSDPKHSAISIQADPQDFVMEGVTLKYLIEYALGLHSRQIKHLPSWASIVRFDIFAKMTSGSSEDGAGNQDYRHRLLQTRLQSLLRIRFNLQTRETQRIQPVYKMIVIPGGPKVSPSKQLGEYSWGPGFINVSDTTFDNLATMLSNSVDREVINGIQVPGNWIVKLRWSTDDSVHELDAPPSLFTAIREQLGIRLIPARAPIKETIIDRLVLPSPN